MAYETLADELFYGGAAGGGKTDLLLGVSFTTARRSVIYRRETKQFAAIVDRSRALASSVKGWKFNANDATWRGPGNRVIEFGGAQFEWDWTRHQGKPHDLIGWDELPHFTRFQFRVLNGWCRTADPKQRCRIIATGNPPTTPEGRWIVEEFAPWLDSQFPKPAKPGELRYYAVIDEKLVWLEVGDEFIHKGERIKPRSRTFIAARVQDNPTLMATDYVSTLQSLPEPIRSQFLYGDFDAGQDDDPWQVIPTSWVRKAMERWTKEAPKDATQSCIGVDVARGGRDKTVLAVRYGNYLAPLQKHEGRTTPDGPSVATLAIKAHEDDSIIHIDVIGIGSSAYDYLKEHKWLTTVPINNAEHRSVASLRDRSGKLKFTNLRAASYWRLRELLDPNGSGNVMLPPDNELVADLCAPRYKVLSSGIQVEAKADIAERIGRSPDCADAVVMAFWDPAKPLAGLRILPSNRKGSAKQLRIVLAHPNDLAHLTPEDHNIVVTLTDYDAPHVLPLTKLDNQLDSVRLSFADLDPEDYQAAWGEPVEPYNKPITDVVLTKDQAKKLWSVLLRKRDPIPLLWIISDENEQRRLSVGLALCAGASLPSESTLCKASDPEWKVNPEDDKLTSYIYRTIKEARHFVMGVIPEQMPAGGWSRMYAGVR
jgi:hypothetical protein